MKLRKLCKTCHTWRHSHPDGQCHSCHYAEKARLDRNSPDYPNIVKLREEANKAFEALERAFGALERRMP